MLTGCLDHRATPLVLAAALGCLTLAGCASAPPPKPAVVEAGPVKERVDTGATYFESEIGGMDQDGVERRFKSLMGPITRCFESGSERVEQIGGSFTVSFRVDRQGKTRWAYMKASTIGDRGTESCILDIVRLETWPRPLSGEGLAEKTIDIEPSKQPHVLDEKRVKALAKIAKKHVAKTCRKAFQGGFLATLYLEPNGKVRTAGLSTPNEKADAVADCITSEIQKLRFTATGKLAKVSFEM